MIFIVDQHKVTQKVQWSEHVIKEYENEFDN